MHITCKPMNMIKGLNGVSIS